MANQAELACVSCETTFEPAPNGGFCPDCDTPHPDYERQDSDDSDDLVDGEDAAPDDEEQTAESPADEHVANEEGTDSSEDEQPPASNETVDGSADELTDGDEETDSSADKEPTGNEDAESPTDEHAAASDEDAEDSEDEQLPTSDEDAESPAIDADSADENTGSDVTPVGDSEAGGEEPPADEDEEAGDADANMEDADGVEADDECPACNSAVDAAAAFCPSCGTELRAENEPDSTDRDECPDCGTTVTDESFCPSCGADLGTRQDAADETTDGSPEEVTLVIAGESYTLGDGEIFGRQDERWLPDLVTASGGRDEASYVSGDHLRFDIEDDGAYVTDLSTNGTARNGEDLDGDTVQLEAGDTLTLAGRAEIDVEL